jgi:uncharacterized protein HemY
LAGLLLACGALACTSVSAETLQELDALSDLSADEAAGIESAKQQAGHGQYLDALATLERVLAVHPKSREALLVHALYLCAIDDRQGGLVEISKLKKKDYGKKSLKQSRAQCEMEAKG